MVGRISSIAKPEPEEVDMLSGFGSGTEPKVQNSLETTLTLLVLRLVFRSTYNFQLHFFLNNIKYIEFMM